MLTVNGKAAVVVQDAENYQLLIELELLESMVGIRKSIAEFEQGKGMPLEEAFQHLQELHDIPD